MTNYEQMREALMQVSLSCSACPRHNCKGCTRPFASFMPTVRKALALPRRQCDVGTAEDQAERFAKYCDRFHRCKGCPCCGKMKYNRCEFIWAQTPYAAERKGGTI